MLERLFLLAGLAAVVVSAWLMLRAWRQWRVRRLRAERLLTGLVPEGRPAVVAFSAPHCGECRSRQAPALARLAVAVGDAVTVTTISALDNRMLVDRLGILTVPATVVVDAQGHVRHLNLGYTGEQTLQEQVSSLAWA